MIRTGVIEPEEVTRKWTNAGALLAHRRPVLPTVAALRVAGPWIFGGGAIRATIHQTDDMGAWDVVTFENDDASDWGYQLESATDLTLVRNTLLTAAEPSGYLEAPACVEALAAAEVVAALAGRPAPDLPEEVRDWTSGHRLAV